MFLKLVFLLLHIIYYAFTHTVFTESKTPSNAPLWSQSKMYPIDTEDSPPESPKHNIQQNLLNQTTPVYSSHQPEPVCRSNSSSNLYTKSGLNSSSGNLYKTSSIYSLDRTSPYRSATRPQLSLLRNSPSPGGRPSLPSLPQRPQSMVATSQLATDSSSDSSPTELTPVKSGRQVSARPIGTRHRLVLV